MKTNLRKPTTARTQACRWKKRHLLAGWWGLLVFLSLGIGLEIFHAFRVSWLLAEGMAQRRFMLTLAHAHGTLFSLLQIAMAATVLQSPALARPGAAWISWMLVAGQGLLPLGFLLAGLSLVSGEPGPGIFLVPVGAACLLAGVAAVAIRLPHALNASPETRPD